jgi:hypothetical protein
MLEVFAIVDGTRRDAHKHDDGLFKCYPRSSNLVASARCFSELRDAAAFLVQHPEWGIRMQPGSPIIYEGIQIARR